MTVEITADGSPTLRSPIHGDTYHSLRGAVGEARHVFIEAGFREFIGTDSALRHCETERRSNPETEAGLLRDFDPIVAAEQCSALSARRSLRENRLRPRNDVPGSPPVEGRSLSDRECNVAGAGELKMPGNPPGGNIGCPEGAGWFNKPIKILEMGLGTGLNAMLTLLEAERTGCRVDYTAVEAHPVPEGTAAKLNYTSDPRFIALHRAPWGEWTEPSEGFRLLKLHSDFENTKLFDSFDVVYWDAFAPDTQPELWTAEIFGRIFSSMNPGGVLTTYSSKGDVRRALQSAGFTVERLPGALGKRHMLRAIKS